MAETSKTQKWAQDQHEALTYSSYKEDNRGRREFPREVGEGPAPPFRSDWSGLSIQRLNA
jgi:hypothetical protein